MKCNEKENSLNGFWLMIASSLLFSHPVQLVLYYASFDHHEKIYCCHGNKK